MADSDTTKVNLQNDVTVNGRTFKAGQNVEVPRSQADDIARIDYDREQVKAKMMTKQTYEVNGGTFSAGNGAQ